ncbi:glycosyltransferase WbuB [Paenibacillus sp. SYP-B3998]|uniref:Glycosyltransferase WbuB n=2 Tax=Paenibacillus sp. SYP-B3998 TaxID=2678564 RepID=A0A6G3ZY60_9BACL|nr:glycosyltransferase WbuB [Paenibacillus sp. SYP-B3998]
MPVSTNKILLYSINYAPELTGIGKYNAEMVAWLVQNGYEVRVVTAPPYYPEWKIKQGYSGKTYTNERMHGAEVWRCPLWVPKKLSGAKRLMHLASFAVTSIPVIIRQMAWKPNLIIVVEPPLAISPVAILLSKMFKVKSWLHVQDLEVDAAFDLGILPQNKGIKSIVMGVERWMMKKFTIVSSISSSMNDRLLKKGVAQDQIRFFPNWVVVSDIFPQRQPVLTYREQLGIQGDDVVVLYSGNMGAKQGLEILLEAAEKLVTNPRIRFILCGDGAAKEKLMEIAVQKKLRNVDFIPLQPKEALNDLLNTADIHALIQKKNASDLVMPSKLTGMLASGRSIIATSGENTALYDVMKKAAAGIVVPPEDLEQLTKAIQQLAQNESGRTVYGRNAREYALNCLSIDSIMANFEKDYTDLVSPRSVTKSRANMHTH